MPHILLKYKFSILVAMCVLYLCARPSIPPVFDVVKNHETFIETDFFSLSFFELRDHLGHVFSYTILSFVVALESYRDGIGLFASKMRLLALLLPSIYGGIVEVLQELFFPLRSAELSDWLEDVLGASFGYLCACLFLPRIICLNKN